MAAGKKGKTDGKSQPKGDGPKAGKGKEGKNAEQNDQKATKVKGAQNYWISHILCEKHSKKEEALTLLKEGETDFASVAKLYSLDKPNQGGALGKKKKGDLLPEFEKVAFALPEFKDSKDTRQNYPYGDVKTSEGYHIIIVTKRE